MLWGFKKAVRLGLIATLLPLTAASLLLAPVIGGQNPRRDEEVLDPYKKWLEEDVRYLITDEERAVFAKLQTSDERDAFIEQFWARRDPDPRTPGINEFREEHYRRIAYANDHFRSGIEGWATDRGRVYIIFGPPDQLEDFPGGLYERPLSEGGGTTSTYAFQKWYYRHLERVGSGIELEFVDPTHSGEYRLALRPSEKDALFLSGEGLTIGESLGLETRAGRVRSDRLMRNIGLEGDPLYMRGAQPFERLRQYFDVIRPPEIKFGDFETLVETQIHFDRMPIETSVAVFRVGPDRVLAPVTLRLHAKELTYRQVGQVWRALMSIYGRVEDLLKRQVYEFEELLQSDQGGMDRAKESGTVLSFQKALPLRPGRYKLTLMLRDEHSGRTSVSTVPVQIEAIDEQMLTTSTLVLADRILSSNGADLTDPFVVPSGFRIFPRTNSRFNLADRCYLYVEAYEVAIDQSTLQPSIAAQLFLISGRNRVELGQPKVITLKDRLAFLHEVDLGQLPPGEYVLEFHLLDRISGQRVIRHTNFEVNSQEGT